MGYGVIESIGNHMHPIAFGCIETTPDSSVAVRLQAIYREMTDVIRNCKPEVMAVEQLFFNRNTTTAFVVGQARGVALLASAEAGLECAEYTPMQVKQAVVGYGKADKQQIQEMVKLLLNLIDRPKPDDTADALAVAITHAHSAVIESAVRRSIRDIDQARASRVRTPDRQGQMHWQRGPKG